MAHYKSHSYSIALVMMAACALICILSGFAWYVGNQYEDYKYAHKADVICSSKWSVVNSTANFDRSINVPAYNYQSSKTIQIGCRIKELNQ